MNLSRINLNLLVALDALLTECNVTKAGEKIFLTQSAMSVALRQLRELFEDELLERKGNALILTPRANELLPQLQIVLSQIKNMTQRQSFDPQTSQRIFTLGMTEYSAFVLLPSLYNYLKQHAPLVELEIKHLLLYGETALLEKKEVDLCVGLTHEDNNLNKELLFSDHAVCVARADHPLIKQPLTFEAYLEANHLSYLVRNNSCPYVTDVILARMGSPRKIALRVPYVVPALYSLVQSDLLMTVPHGIFQEAKKLLPIAMQPIPFMLPALSFYQTWHSSSEDEVDHRWLRWTIKNVAETLASSY